MAGLFGLGKTKYVDEPDKPLSESGETKEAFFLNPDEAKTLGNVEFMRKAKTIKRTFPKTRNSQGAQVVQQISSMEKKPLNSNGVVSPMQSPSQAQGKIENTQSGTETERRKGDSSIDMFRKMAREIKK